jgi:hypothetical protein
MAIATFMRRERASIPEALLPLFERTSWPAPAEAVGRVATIRYRVCDLLWRPALLSACRRRNFRIILAAPLVKLGGSGLVGCFVVDEPFYLLLPSLHELLGCDS